MENSNDPFKDFHIINIPATHHVNCDLCNEDFTTSNKPGGYLFSGKAVGPCCADKFEESAKKYDELQYIIARCPDDMSFGDWVRNDLR